MGGSQPPRLGRRYRLPPLGSFGAETSKGPIVTDPHWVRLARRHRRGQSLQTPIGFVWRGDIEGANRYRPPLGSFGAGVIQGCHGSSATRAREQRPTLTGSENRTRGTPGPGSRIIPARHWVRFARGHRGGQSLQTPIGFVWRRRIAEGQSLQTTIGFVWLRRIAGGQSLQIAIGFVWPGASRGANRYRLPLGSFGAVHRGGPIVTDSHWVRLAPAHRGGPIVTDYHWVRLARVHRGGPIVTDPHWVRLARVHRGGPIVTDYHWVRLARVHRGGPIVTDPPLGSFGTGASRGSNRYSLPLGSFRTGISGASLQLAIGFVSHGGIDGHDPHEHWCVFEDLTHPPDDLASPPRSREKSVLYHNYRNRRGWVSGFLFFPDRPRPSAQLRGQGRG